MPSGRGQGGNGPVEPGTDNSNNLSAPPETTTLAELWPRIIDAAAKSAGMSSAIRDVAPGQRQPAGDFELKLFNPDREKFVRARLGDIQTLATELAGHPVKLSLAAPEPAAPAAEEPASDADAVADAMNDPLVRQAVELFEGRVVRVIDHARNDTQPSDHQPEGNEPDHV